MVIEDTCCDGDIATQSFTSVRTWCDHFSIMAWFTFAIFTTSWIGINIQPWQAPLGRAVAGWGVIGCALGELGFAGIAFVRLIRERTNQPNTDAGVVGRFAFELRVMVVASFTFAILLAGISRFGGRPDVASFHPSLASAVGPLILVLFLSGCSYGWHLNTRAAGARKSRNNNRFDYVTTVVGALIYTLALFAPPLSSAGFLGSPRLWLALLWVTAAAGRTWHLGIGPQKDTLKMRMISILSFISRVTGIVVFFVGPIAIWSFDSKGRSLFLWVFAVFIYLCFEVGLRYVILRKNLGDMLWRFW